MSIVIQFPGRKRITMNLRMAIEFFYCGQDRMCWYFLMADVGMPTDFYSEGTSL